jgi:hypothetical protein
MAVRLKEWTQREWTQPDVHLFRQEGDFYELSELYRDYNRRMLKRSPGISGQVDFTAITPLGAFFDSTNERFVFIGTDGTDLETEYSDNAWSVSNGGTVLASETTLGGIDGQNVLYWGSKLYFIEGTTNNVHAGNGYTSAHSALYSGNDALCLCGHGDFVYAACSDGDVERLLDSTTETLYECNMSLSPKFLVSFRQQLLMLATGSDGTTYLYRISDAGQITTIGQLPGESGDLPSAGVPYAIHEDRLYFIPGEYTDASGTNKVSVWAFNGSQLERIAELDGTISNTGAIGLTTWRGELLFYRTQTTTAANNVFKILTGNQFTTFISDTPVTYSSYTPRVYNLGNEIIIFSRDSGGYGFQHTSGLADGYIITSYLDGGYPTRPKRLNTVAVTLNGSASDFKVIFKYRKDNETAWTTIETHNNDSIPRSEDQGIEFYKIQFRIDIDDDSGNNEDIAIAAIACTYSVDDR